MHSFQMNSYDILDDNDDDDDDGNKLFFVNF